MIKCLYNIWNCVFSNVEQIQVIPHRFCWSIQSRQHDWCLAKEMKTSYLSVNHSAGMCTEPPQCVEQLMVLPEGLYLIWLSVSALHHDWLSCLLIGWWWGTESLMSSHWGFTACNEEFHISATHSLRCIFLYVYWTSWCNIFTSVNEWYKHLA